ncbi:MAG: hypothetical protein CVT49_06045 [candidate division Zixibacteria bacterium HGW-Zixibacteria-1]|nr:MAG: hypothetical protein CVT49_06045 [candidate division Zixibacteria bacterium HGW-Zixibacteria-1]
MQTALPLAGLILVLIGFILLMRSMWLRKPDHPTITGESSWRYSIFPWKYKQMWVSSGYLIFMLGQYTLMAGLILLAINQFLIN